MTAMTGAAGKVGLCGKPMTYRMSTAGMPTCDVVAFGVTKPCPRSGAPTARTVPIGGLVDSPLPAQPPTAAAQPAKAAKPVTAEELFASSYPKLAGWVRRLVDDDDTAHEIASEAFVRLLSKWTRLDSPQSYLYMIATNLVRDHWRKTERERRAIRSVTATADREPAANPALDVDIRELIHGLPAKLRSPFLLHYYAGFGIKEISILLKRPEGTIKADLYHARSRLREALGVSDGR